MDNLEQFLDAGQPANDEAQPVEAVEAEAPAEANAESQEPEAQARERDERGRFKAKEADEPVMVPLKALHETRDELKALKAELDQYRAQAQPQQQPQAPPDIFENPEGFAQYQDMRLQAATLNTTLNLSESMAKRYAGAEAVEQAKAWGQQAFSANPAFYQQFLQQPDPYGFLIDQYERATTFAKIGDDPSQIEAFLAWKAAQANAQAQPAPAQQPVPTSLADAQSARGTSETFSAPTLDQILGRTP